MINKCFYMSHCIRNFISSRGIFFKFYRMNKVCRIYFLVAILLCQCFEEIANCNKSKFTLRKGRFTAFPSFDHDSLEDIALNLKLQQKRLIGWKLSCLDTTLSNNCNSNQKKINSVLRLQQYRFS